MAGTTPLNTTAINEFLVSNGLRIVDNPCISPDFCLDWAALAAKLTANGATALKVYEQSGFSTAAGDWRLGEDTATGDFAWLLKGGSGEIGLAQGVAVAGGWTAFPASFANLIALKNATQAHDAGCTIFPTASGTLEYQSLGIGARMTTLHWPACDWAMANLGLSVTANQNSIPRELVRCTSSSIPSIHNPTAVPPHATAAHLQMLCSLSRYGTWMRCWRTSSTCAHSNSLAATSPRATRGRALKE